MNNPASALLDGLASAGMHWPLILGILLLLVTSQLLLASFLYKIFNERFTGEEYLSLSLAGWLLPATIISLLWYLAAQILSPLISSILIGILMVAALAWCVRIKWLRGASRGVVWLLILLAGLSILIRLAFVSGAVFPSYFDSAQHYFYIKQLLAPIETGQNGLLQLPGYYHLGFHFLAAFLTYAARAEITDVILVLGQVILALMPFSAFFIVRHWTHSSTAGFLGLTLAALGWYMPAHAMDWGKYPALASLALLPFVLSIAYLSIENRKVLSKEKFTALLLLLLAGALISVILHSRSIVVYLLLAGAWLVTTLWNRMSWWPRILTFNVFLWTLVVEIFYIRSQGILGPLFDAYGPKGMLLSVCVFVLSVFAFRTYPSFVVFCTVSIDLLIASLFLSLGNLVPGYANTTPLDRPYVQMILYLPLTLLAGFGLGGLEQLLMGETLPLGRRPVAVSKILGVLLIALIAVHGLLKYELYPSSCCVIVSQDDLKAIQWLDENLPADARILTSTTDLNVLPTDQYQGSAGGDAGTWIYPLTGRPVHHLPFNTDIRQSQTFEMLCQQQVSFIYVGKTGWTFDEASMNAQPEKYKLLLDLPKAKIYELTGCN